ncbi:MAG: hypothetical protein OXG26_10210 [Caldilineaceae bacterium]|nr:hypothetical protein [Caldilineaceae bacterium]
MIDYNRFLYARGNPLKYTDPTGHNPLGPEWVEAFKAAHGGRAPNAQDRADRLASLATPGGVSGSRAWTDADWKHYANNKRQVLTKAVAKAGIKTEAKAANVTSQEETDAGASPQGWGDKLKSVASNIVHALIPPGATSVGVTVSTGAVLDVTGETGLFFDKSGDTSWGISVGVGGNTGANVDAGFYVQSLPWASGAGAMEGWTVNFGISGVIGPLAGLAVGGEINMATDPKTGEPTFGGTVIGGAAAKANIPFPPVELYGNATHTWFIYEFNLFDTMGLPRPE